MTLQNDNYSANQAGRGLRKKNNAKGYGAAKSRKKKKHWDMFVSDFDNQNTNLANDKQYVDASHYKHPKSGSEC